MGDKWDPWTEFRGTCSVCGGSVFLPSCEAEARLCRGAYAQHGERWWVCAACRVPVRMAHPTWDRV